MALHHQLPIYKVAYNLFDLVTNLVRNMPRDFKQSIGGEINRECLRIVVLIARANSARDKAPHLSEQGKADPAPTTSANEPAAPVKTLPLLPAQAWPFPTGAKA